MLVGKSQSGFSLIELLVVIVVIGIMVAVALQTMTTTVEDARVVGTEREMVMLAEAIVGDPELTQNGIRSDFGYVGDVSAFPSGLQSLYQNPGGYATWDGPYLAAGYDEDNSGFLLDEWGEAYSYTGGVTIVSSGGGSNLTHRLASTADDYLLNTLNGTIRDLAGNPPGADLADSVDLVITFPDGTGGMTSKIYHPNPAGSFTLDSLPVGEHALNVVFAPLSDTLHRYVTILPRHKSSHSYTFAASYFTVSLPSCTGSGTLTLRPTGAGAVTELDHSGCSENWQCVAEETPDDGSSQVYRLGSFRTDLYEIEDAPLDVCSITAVRVTCRGHKTTLFLAGTLRAVIHTNGAEYEGSDHTLGNAWEDYVEQWNVNPGTGSSWTWEEINDLQAGVSLDSDSPIFAAGCTQVWVEVDYEP